MSGRMRAGPIAVIKFAAVWQASPGGDTAPALDWARWRGTRMAAAVAQWLHVCR